MSTRTGYTRVEEDRLNGISIKRPTAPRNMGCMESRHYGFNIKFCGSLKDR